MNRRYFLKSSGIALASFGLMGAAPEFLHQFASAQTGKDTFGRKKTLIVIFQRGAVDGLNMVVPYGEDEYYNLRRTIAIQSPTKTDGAVDLDPRPVDRQTRVSRVGRQSPADGDGLMRFTVLLLLVRPVHARHLRCEPTRSSLSAIDIGRESARAAERFSSPRGR